jgi:hypothetical protein
MTNEIETGPQTDAGEWRWAVGVANYFLATDETRIQNQ